MIQDAHPIRSGIPDHYKANYKIAVTVAASTWTVNDERMPSGFGAGTNVFSATGIANLIFPAGQKVRGARASVAAPTAVIGSARHAQVTTINETLGTCQVMITDLAVPALANPIVDSIIFVELDLETV
jgi:hypothetical protein